MDYVNDNMSVRYSRCATDEEIDNITTKVNVTAASCKAGGMPVRYDGRYLNVLSGSEHCLICGSTGSGKTTYEILWALHSMTMAGHSMLIHDAKGELYSYMYNFMKKKGYKIYVLNFQNPERGMRYNPLYYAEQLYRQGNRSKAIQILGDVYKEICKEIHSEKDTFWETVAQQGLIGTTELLFEKGDPGQATLENVFHLFNCGIENAEGGAVAGLRDESNFKRYYSQYEEEKPASWNKLQAIDNTASETKASILGVLNTAIGRYTSNEALLSMLSGQDIYIEDMVERKTALFIISNDSSSFYSSIVSLIVNQIYNRLKEIADARVERTLPNRVEFVLDEFPTLQIPDCEKKLSTCRSRNIRFNICIQSLTQLSTAYGDERAAVILDNIGDWIYLHSSDMKFLEMISKRCGITKSRYTREERPLFTVSDLSRLKKGEFIYIGRETFPYVCHMKPYYEFEKRGELFPISQIPMKAQTERKLFNILQKISEYEMTKNMKVGDPFYDLNRNEIMIKFSNKNPLEVQGYLLFDTKLRKVISNRINHAIETEIIATFQYGKHCVVCFRITKNENGLLGTNKEDDDKVIYFSFYNDALRFTALKEISQNLEMEIREAFCNVRFGNAKEDNQNRE